MSFIFVELHWKDCIVEESQISLETVFNRFFIDLQMTWYAKTSEIGYRHSKRLISFVATSNV